MTNKNLNIYMLEGNLNSFKEYLKADIRDSVKEYYINKKEMGSEIKKGLIFVFEETFPPPKWTEYINEISLRKKVVISQKKASKCVVFLKIHSVPFAKTFALTFGNGDQLLDPSLVISDFGLKISKSLLTVDEIISIDSMSIDRKIFNTRKQSAALLMPEKLRDYRSNSIIKRLYGSTKKSEEGLPEGFSVGGSEALKFSGKLDLLGELGAILGKFGGIYQGYSTTNKKFILSDDLILVSSKKEKDELDEILGKRIFEIINSDSIDKRKTSSLKISPQEIFDLDNFNGFFIKGLGYKPSSKPSDFSIDEVDYFTQFKRKLKEGNNDIHGILNKIKTDEISKKSIDTNELERLCSVYKALNFETRYKNSYYLLVSGKWYEFDKDFYNKLKEDINSIKKVDKINGQEFIPFNTTLHSIGGTKSEGKYNEDLAEKNNLLSLDKRGYTIGPERKKEYEFKSGSNIEICDVLHYTDEIIQFTHIKRHSGASGVSHLLSQSLASAQTFNNDKEDVIKYINAEIEEFNNENPTRVFNPLEDKGQRKEVILVIIDKNADADAKNSKMLSILEMLSLRENMQNVSSLGYTYYLNFVVSDS